MAENENILSQRKKEHLQLCLTDKVLFKKKTSGFEKYDFKHFATTEVEIDKIDLTTDFFGKKISFPFLISCMTGGADEADNINLELAEAARELNVPLGLGSLRYALDTDKFNSSLKEIKKKAGSSPILGNIGAAQIVQMKDFSPLQKLNDLIEATAFVVHVNPLQELLQKNGEPSFKGLLKSIGKFCRSFTSSVIVKEVGSGISPEAAEDLLEAGVKGIDVAGAGGTSWAGIEVLRNKQKENPFWDWGLPTTYCIRNISRLKNDFDFILIGSGGVNNSFDAAKALALGADITASARVILQKLNEEKVEGVINLIKNWFDDVKKIMFLTASKNLGELNKKKLIRKKDLF